MEITCERQEAATARRSESQWRVPELLISFRLLTVT